MRGWGRVAGADTITSARGLDGLSRTARVGLAGESGRISAVAFER